MDQLSRLRTKKAQQLGELAKMQIAVANTEAEISALESALAQHLGIANPAPTPDTAPLLHNTQPPATIAYQESPVPAVRQAPQTQIRKPMAQATTTEQTPQKGIQPCTSIPVQRSSTSVAVSTLQRVPTRVQPKQGVQVPKVADMISRRAPYHTEELQITGVVPTGEIVLYEHYLSGDGINYGVPALEDYPVKVKTSKAGKVYRLMEGPTLKITCTLATALPENLPEKKRIIREWLAANNYMACDDPNKVQFLTEYDTWGEEYTPYVAIDSVGLTLYVYIGASSLENPTPCPWLIA